MLLNCGVGEDFWESLGLQGDHDRGWGGWMASLTQWIRVWVNTRSWWWTGRLGVLQSMGSQRVRHNWATELNWWMPVWRFLKTLGLKPPYKPAIQLLGIYLDEIKIERDTCIPLFIAALFTIARTWKQPRCPSTDGWIKKCGTYTQRNITQP